MNEIRVYRNKRNENKYIELKKTKCSHFYYRQFIKTHNPKLNVTFTNYTTYNRRKGKAKTGLWLRMTKNWMQEALNLDYDLVGVKRV